MKCDLIGIGKFDTSAGIDISIPLSSNPDSVRAWYCEPVQITPVETEHFIGDVNRGGSVNFRNIFLNPHGNGTHTECVGHISKENYTINQCLREFHFLASVLTVQPKPFFNEEFLTEDLVIDADLLAAAIKDLKKGQQPKAIIIRTAPNDSGKTKYNYSNTNPPYLTKSAVAWILDQGFEHLVLDLPSVDREMDKGRLEGHHLFWNYPSAPQIHRTITEMAYIPDQVRDGIYLLTFQITSLESDASPSKLVLYVLE